MRTYALHSLLVEPFVALAIVDFGSTCFVIAISNLPPFVPSQPTSCLPSATRMTVVLHIHLLQRWRIVVYYGSVLEFVH